MKSELLAENYYNRKRHQLIQADLIEQINLNLNIKKWGFDISYKSETAPVIIYNSDCCRIKFRLGGGRFGSSDSELYITYARLHAPDRDAYMMWNGIQCNCWHRSDFLCLFFLEGYSPEHVLGEWVFVPYLKKYWDSEEGLDLRIKNPAEFGFKLEAKIWERYASRLFELYDMRNQGLWNDYRKFLEEFYRIKNWKPHPIFNGETPPPPPWMIC